MASSTDLSLISNPRSLSTASLLAHTMTLSSSFWNPSLLEAMEKYRAQRRENAVRNLKEKKSMRLPVSSLSAGEAICISSTMQNRSIRYEMYTMTVYSTLLFHRYSSIDMLELEIRLFKDRCVYSSMQIMEMPSMPR